MATINTPLPGVFYRRPAPDEPEYVVDGDEVEEGQVIGLIEVMKTYTELKSTAAGTIAEFLVEDEAEVSAGQEIAMLR